MSFPIQPAVNDAKRKRNALAGTIRAALLRLEASKLTASSNPQARFEVEALEKALAALLEPSPERGDPGGPRTTGGDQANR